MANQGPYIPPDYSANSDDFLQYLSQMQGGSQGLGGFPSNPPSGMSPSMPWMGGPQDYTPMGQGNWQGMDPGMNPGMGQMAPMGGQFGYGPDEGWKDPGYTSFGPEGGQQQQQGPTGHPILDKLMSPDMQDRAMAAAIFARGFIAPQETINWAMQIRQQRQAQEARAQNVQDTLANRMEIAKEKAAYEKQVKAASRAQTIARTAYASAEKVPGIDVNEFMAMPENAEYDETDPVWAGRLRDWVATKVSEAKANEAKTKRLDATRTLITDGKVKDITTLDAYKKGTPEERIELEELQTTTQDLSKLRYETMKARKHNLETSAAYLEKLTPAEKNSLNDAQDRISDIDKRVDELTGILEDNSKLRNFGRAMAAGGELTTGGRQEAFAHIKAEIDALNAERDEIVKTKHKVARGKGTAPVLRAQGKAPAQGGDSEGGDEGATPSDDDLAQFTKRWSSNTDPKYREKLKKFMADKYPGIAIEQYIPAE